MKLAPVYDMQSAQPVLHTTDLGNHQTSELADGTMTICTNTIDMEECDFEALASVRLDELEQYRLYTLLHTKFTRKGK
jgi:hypothetical protein